ncbi:MAG: tail fiber protein, partial [Clostridia bacterium]|nr:tail fiber protein [Clostridia bacterium]MBR4117197.1 tail fiber protein [Clostridia bacterium]
MIIKQTKEMTDSERIAAENSNNQYLRTLTYAPIGMIIPFGGSVIPNAFLLCDGSVLNTTEYADLFNAIGYTYGGSGDTFKIPDFVSTTLNDVSVKFIIKTANGITEKERLEILGNVDQTYNPESENAQSGKAVAAAIEGIEIPSADQTYNPESENAQSGKAVAAALQEAKDECVPIPNYKETYGIEKVMVY